MTEQVNITNLVPQLSKEDCLLLASRTPGESQDDYAAKLEKLVQDNVRSIIQKYNSSNSSSDSLHRRSELIRLGALEGSGSDCEFAETTSLSFSLELIRHQFMNICAHEGIDLEKWNVAIQIGNEGRTSFTLLDTRDHGGKVDFRIYIPEKVVRNIIKDVSDIVGRIYTSKSNYPILEKLSQDERREIVLKSLKFFCNFYISSEDLVENLLIPFEFKAITKYSPNLQKSYAIHIIELVSGLAHEVRHIKQALDDPNKFDETTSATLGLSEAAKSNDYRENLERVAKYVNDEGEQDSRQAEIEALTSLKDSLSDKLNEIELRFSGAYVEKLCMSKRIAIAVITDEIEHLQTKL